MGLSIGLLIMLPIGLYVGTRNTDRQIGQIDTIIMTKDNDSGTAAQGVQPEPEKQTQSSSQPNTNNTKPTPNSTQAPSSTYKASICTNIKTPYTTSSQIASYLGSTEYSTNMGNYEGTIKTCTADSTGYKPPDITLGSPGHLIIYVGTGGITSSTAPRTTPPEPDQESRIKADCSVQLAGHGNQGAYELCVSTLKKYFNIP